MDNVDRVIEILKENDAVEAFKGIPFDKLIQLHHGLGRQIRNELMLWANEWTPEVIDGVDHSKKHPDAVSMRLIEDTWKRLNNGKMYQQLNS